MKTSCNRAVSPGASATFTVTPDAGYLATVSGTCGGTLTGSTYTTTQSDVGKVITVEASYTDAAGTAEMVASAATAAVGNVDDAAVITIGNEHEVVSAEGVNETPPAPARAPAAVPPPPVAGAVPAVPAVVPPPPTTSSVPATQPGPGMEPPKAPARAPRTMARGTVR